MPARDHISLRTKLASTLLALGHVSYDDAKLITEEQIISLYHFDHGILNAIKKNNSYWNLTPRLIAEHREKTRRDIAIVAKVKRLERKYSVLPASETNACLPVKYKRKWPSRPWAKGRPLRTRPKSGRNAVNKPI